MQKSSHKHDCQVNYFQKLKKRVALNTMRQTSKWLHNSDDLTKTNKLFRKIFNIKRRKDVRRLDFHTYVACQDQRVHESLKGVKLNTNTLKSFRFHTNYNVIRMFNYLLGLTEAFRKPFNKLKDLNVEFDYLTNIRQAKPVIESFKPVFYKLKKISITFYYSEVSTERGYMKVVKQILRHCVNINSLSLYFKDCQSISRNDIMSLSQYLTNSRLTNLKTLTLQFSSSNGLFQIMPLPLIGLLSKSLSNVQNLSLVFDKNLLYDHNLARFMQYGLAKHMNRLKSLKMSFSSSAVSDFGVLVLCRSIYHGMENLEGLHLCFSHCKDISFKSIRALDALIRGDFGKLWIVNKDDKLLEKSENFEQVRLMRAKDTKLVKIKELSFNFNYCYGITSSSIEELSDCISKVCPSLRKLGLYFKGVESEAEEDFEAFITMLQGRLLRLKSLAFNDDEYLS